MDEITKAIKSLKNEKSAGPDGMPAVVLKVDEATTAKILHPVFQQILNEKDLPQDQNTVFIIKHPMKEDLSACKNYLGIMLLPVPGKVLNRILLAYLKDAVDKKL